MSATDYMQQAKVREQMKQLQASELWRRVAERQRGRA